MKKLMLFILVIASAAQAVQEWTGRFKTIEDTFTGKAETCSEFAFTGQAFNEYEQAALRNAGFACKLVDDEVPERKLLGGLVGFLVGSLAGCVLNDNEIDQIQRNRIVKAMTVAVSAAAGTSLGAYIYGKVVTDYKKSGIEKRYLKPGGGDVKVDGFDPRVFAIKRDLRSLLRKDIELNGDCGRRLKGNPSYYFREGQSEMSILGY